MNDNVVLIINCERDAAESIRNAFAGRSDVSTQVSSRKNLDGSAAAWVVLATVAIKTLPLVLAEIRQWAARNKVEHVKVGDVEIKNPTDMQVAQLLDGYLKGASSEGNV